MKTIWIIADAPISLERCKMMSRALSRFSHENVIVLSGGFQVILEDAPKTGWLARLALRIIARQLTGNHESKAKVSQS